MIARKENGIFGNCDECGKPINELSDLGYMGEKDRGNTSCNPFVEWETKCAECEGGCVLDKPKEPEDD